MRRLIFVQPYYYSNSYKYENAKKKWGGGVNLTVPQTIDTSINRCVFRKEEKIGFSLQETLYLSVQGNQL